MLFMYTNMLFKLSSAKVYIYIIITRLQINDTFSSQIYRVPLFIIENKLSILNTGVNTI